MLSIIIIIIFFFPFSTYVHFFQAKGIGTVVVVQADGVSGLVDERRADMELFFQEMCDALVELDGVAGHQVGDQSQRVCHSMGPPPPFSYNASYDLTLYRYLAVLPG